MVHYALFPTPIGDCGIAWRDDLIVATRLPDETPEKTAGRMASQTEANIAEPPSSVRHAIAAITRLLEGVPTDLARIACSYERTDAFGEKVCKAARRIPAGEVATYGALASQLGDSGLARRVGQALGRNPLPIIVPCHRVIGTDGRLVGFSATGGIEMKLKLLEIERARFGASQGLFDELPLAMKPQR